MANYNKKISETQVRLGEVRFSYAHVFTPRKKTDGTEGKFGVTVLIPKTDTVAKKMVDEAIDAARKLGPAKCPGWKNKVIPMEALSTTLYDGDSFKYEEQEEAHGMWVLNTSATTKPGVRILENGTISEALDDDDFYSGCWGAVSVNFFPYSNNGNNGVAAGLNNVIKTRDDDRLGGGARSAESDFGDMAGGSFLD